MLRQTLLSLTLATLCSGAFAQQASSSSNLPPADEAPVVAAQPLPTIISPLPASERWDEGTFAMAGAPSYRWYVAPRLGWNISDQARRTHNAGIAGLGVGYWVNPHMTLDLEASGHSADREARSGLPGGDWSTQNVFVTGRWYAGAPSQDTRFYALAGLGVQRHQPVPNKSGWSPAATAGIGLQHNFNDRVALRGELAAIHDRDASSSRNLPGVPNRNHYTDGQVSVGLVIGLDHVEPYVSYHQDLGPVRPAITNCTDLDDDGDRVNNCDDRCPGTTAGTVVGPDGCVQKVVIDLRGVNFKFDRPRAGETDISAALADPQDSSLSTLDQVVDTLNRYPEVRVEVDGHTDSVGTDAYNQGLSSRRAQIVAIYLTDHGIASDRITGVEGFGESHPIAPNDTANGRAQNRRVELQPESE